MPIESFRQAAFDGGASKVFPFPSCVDAVLVVRAPVGWTDGENVMFLDPGGTPTQGSSGGGNTAKSNAAKPGAGGLPAAGGRAASSVATAVARQQWRFGLTLADSAFVRTVALPVGGEIKTHASCGFSLASDKAETNFDHEAVSEAIETLKSLKDPK